MKNKKMKKIFFGLSSILLFGVGGVTVNTLTNNAVDEAIKQKGKHFIMNIGNNNISK